MEFVDKVIQNDRELHTYGYNLSFLSYRADYNYLLPSDNHQNDKFSNICVVGMVTPCYMVNHMIHYFDDKECSFSARDYPYTSSQSTQYMVDIPLHCDNNDILYDHSHVVVNKDFYIQAVWFHKV